ncbi:CGNR zinc finger domain-containing protein [Streptomyces rugosispiralis]|uniref:CGNR zinc finger domain-containing protein n=1 Tax=Streptomyces rugosispiralis TaxID=2967341 RepID=A0ABT1UXB1_9ACTN|nr:CGNR zinc finger domain-containing protein [Streptomyces rugosispiralis]MCQ8189682.1 CGNR zinc finger domain-containing protein [Streptomyces rugosispiralis]
MQVALDDYVWAAGIATELVNTTAEVWRGDDRLPDLAALVAFTEPHGDRPGADGGAPGALAELARRGGPADLRAVHALRTTVRDLIDHPGRDHLVAGATRLTSSAQGATLIPDPAHEGRIRWAVPLRDGATIADALSLICGMGVLGVVHTLGERRFRPCTAPTCRGAFIDTTRPGSRRYCMPGLCGNRVNVANHRARRAATHDRPTSPRDRPVGPE